jgi:hypothetical protein
MRTTSPERSHFGGEKPMPTPAGVPVAMMSPGSSVRPREQVSISVGMSKIMSRVIASCRSSVSPPDGVTQPRTRVSRASSSSAVTIHGPIGQKVSQFLPSIHCWWRTWMSRALTSLSTL